MSEDDPHADSIEEEVPKLKTFIISCVTVDAMEEDLPKPARIGPQEFLDKIDAPSEEEAKDIVTGFLAERDFVVKRWNFVSETKYISELVRALNP